MEEILTKIMKDSSPNKHASIRQSCMETREFLASQHGLMRSPPYELRNRCLDTLQLALESKHNKLISHALSGFQRIVWDKSFQSPFEIDDDEKWLPYQLLQAVISLPIHQDDVQVEILKILLQMACTSGYNLSTRAVLQLVSLCVDVYNNGSAAVRTAAQATANQTLQSFCTTLQETEVGSEEYLHVESDDESNFNILEGLVEELSPVLAYLCEKLKEFSSPRRKLVTSLLLQCLLSILRNLKVEVHQSSAFLDFVWQELCPLLVALLGSPKTDKNIVSSQKSISGDGNEIGRGSGCLAAAPSCQSAEARTVYNIAIELVRLVGGVCSLRPVLESLFHRMLLYPPPQHRLEALKAMKELMKKPDLLLQFAAQPLHGTADTNSRSGDLDLIRIAMDSLGECCHSNDISVCYTSVSCVVALLASLEEICAGDKIPTEYINHINSMFRTVESADYKGVKSDQLFKMKLGKSNSAEQQVQKYDKVTGPVSDQTSNAVKYDISVDTSNSTLPDASCNFSHLKELRNESEAELENESEIELGNESEIEIENESDIEIEVGNEIVTNQDEGGIKNEIEVEDKNEYNAVSENNFTDKITNQDEQVNVNSKIMNEDININNNNEKEISSVPKGNVKNIEPERLSVFCLNVLQHQVSVAEIAREVKEDDISSSTTEGPSSADNLDDEMLRDLEEQERQLAQREADRRKKVPHTLLGQEDAGKEERERVERLCEARLEFAQQERQNARRFVKVLQSFLPKLLAIRSSIEADQALQEFASSYCEELWQSQQSMNTSNSSDEDIVSHITILNADGIYLAMYSALLLNLKLIRNNYYSDSTQAVPLTENHFIEEVHGSGVLVYLSATWLAELYQQILAINLLETAGYSPGSIENSAVINLLTGLELGVDSSWVMTLSDVDGLGSTQPGAQQLADYRRLERAVTNVQCSPAMEAGMKFCRRILTGCWEITLEVLSVLLNGTNSCGISSTLGFLLGTEGAKEEHRKAKDAIAESLDGLQKAAKLCNALGLQSRCSAVFAQLTAASCPLSQDSLHTQNTSSKVEYRRRLKKPLLVGRTKSLRLHTSHILSMDAILSRGLELGSHSPDCWRYVFQCCMYVLELENTYFSGHSHIPSVLSRPPLHTLSHLDRKDSVNDDLFLPPVSDTIENGFSDLPPMPGSPMPLKVNISEMIKQNGTISNTTGIIKDRQLLEIIEGLSQLVDRLFEEAASRLNLSALIGFLVELCAVSQLQLFTQSYAHFSASGSHGNSLLLYHLGDIMLRCARGGRPLVHVMKSWSVVAPHFVEAACHKDHVISKKAVTTIHDIVSALLSSSSELPHFHFNEALFKPFENLLCLELCDTDVQEQIISSICEFVEGCTTEIRSGWRPLFGALRAVRMPGPVVSTPSLESEREQAHHLRVVLDVFEAFLGTNNVLVFAYAAVDCLLCLLKHVRGPAEMQDNGEEMSSETLENPAIPLDMCLAALKYLERCAEILASMFVIPTCPVFNSANRIQLHSEPNLVDPIIPGMEIVYFKEQDDQSVQTFESSCYVDTGGVNFSEGEMNNSARHLSDSMVTLNSLDKPTGVLHVWFLLLEGLAGAIATCPRRYQPHTMGTLFGMLRSLKDVPGPSFGVYCVNHLLLPMLQSWLRRTTRIYRGWDNFAANFKQCCGLATDLVVDYIQNMTEKLQEESFEATGVKLMLQQLFLVLTECVAQPTETISRLGCACIRHAVMSAGSSFTADLWDIICNNLQRSCRVSLHSIKQLMVCFHSDSDNFYGDLGEVKVAARRDCTLEESERLKQLAHQVFLLDCQRAGSSAMKSDCTADDDRSFIFLLHPPNVEQTLNPEMYVIRVPFRSLVVGLLSHQILLQTLGTLLLQGTHRLLPSLTTLLPSASIEMPTSCDGNSPKSQVPGFLSRLSPYQIQILLSCLEESYKTACEFDTRPGLKFLVQKVAQTNVAANLYKQAGISWTIQILVLFELCLHTEKLTLDTVNMNICSNSNFSASEESLASISSSDIKENKEEKIEKPQAKLCKKFTNEGVEDYNVFANLRDRFKELCETYTEMTLDKDGLLAAVDRITDQPIFFLVAQPDDFIDLGIQRKRTSETLSSDSKEHCRLDVTKQTNCDSSDSEDITTFEDENKDKVYKVATEQTINSLISEYKKRKIHHTMPALLREKLRRRSSASEKRRISALDNSLPEEIDLQRKNSIMKGRQDGKHLQGVGLLLSRHASDALLGYDCINKRFLTAKFRTKIKDLNVICCYAPTEDSDENEKYTFYSQLQDILNSVKKGDIPLVLGDFNAKVGTDSDLWAGVLGPFGIGSSNGNGEYLLQDGEAHLQVWKQLIQSLLDLHLSLPDHQFHAFLPMIFPGVQCLVAYATDAELKLSVAGWLHRLALCCGFNGNPNVFTPES